MAIDTALKRASAINIGCPWRGILPLPDGAVDEEDRPLTVFLYAQGADAPVIVPDQPARSAGGRSYGRIWSPEPERPRTKSQVRKVEKKIEQIAQQPIARIDLASLSMAVQRALAIEVPDYSAIIWLAQQRIEARKLEREQEEERRRAEALAAVVAQENAARLALESERLALEMAERQRTEHRKQNLAKKRDRNKQLIMQMLKWH